MRTHIALLRGINVGGHNVLAMADLRQVMAALGHADVVTYIQSGNVVFTSSDSDTARVARGIEREIAERHGVRPGVVVLSGEELAQVVADNPYPHETNLKSLHAVFGRHEIAAAAVVAAAQRARDAGSRDEARVVGNTLFLHTPDGFGRSELAARLTRSSAAGTARNWATVTKLLALLNA